MVKPDLNICEDLATALCNAFIVMLCTFCMSELACYSSKPTSYVVRLWL